MTARPRLLVLTPDFPPSRGGIQVLAHRLASHLSESFETLVVARGSHGDESFDRAGSLAVRRVRAPGRLGAGRNAMLNAVALAEAMRFRPQLTLSAHIVVSPAAAAIRAILGARTVQYFHAKEVGAKPKLAAFAAAQADVAIPVSSYTAALVRATGGRPGRMVTIHPGVDLPASSAPLASERPTILTIARLEDRYKGHDVLMRALPLVRAKVPAARWVVIGDGPQRRGLEQLAVSYDLTDSVRFLGAVGDQVRDQWLRRADLLAMPSRLPAGGFAGEGFGIVYLEAGAHRKPVVAGNVGGALDAVIDGETGLLVDPADELAVAEAITALLSDFELAARLGAGGARRAATLSWSAVGHQLQELLLDEVRFAP